MGESPVTFIGTCMVLAAVEGWSWVLPTDSPLRRYYFNMKDMRHVTVAQGLVQYCRENLDQDLTVFYPPYHIKDGLMYYLNHPVERAWKYSIYSKIPGITREIREFGYNKEVGWQLSQSSSIF